MRFSLFIVCFFNLFFSAKAEKKVFEGYHQDALSLNSAIKDSVIQFIPTTFSYLIISPAHINAVNKKGQFRQFNDIDYKWAFNSSTSIFPNLVALPGVCHLSDSHFSEIQLFAGFSSLVSIGQKKYGVRNDSLFVFNNSVKHYIYYPTKSVYKIKNRLYIWSKAGSLFELKNEHIHKLYTSDLHSINTPTKLIASPHGLIALYHKPLGIALITNNQLNWIIPFSKKTTVLSSTIFDGKLIILQNDGVIKVLEDNKIGKSKFKFLNINNLNKPLAIASDQKKRLVILLRDSILTYSIKTKYKKEPFKFEKIFPINGNFLCFSKNGAYGWNNKQPHTPNIYLKGETFQLWHGENSDINIVNENGIVRLDKNVTQIVSYKKISASHYHSAFGGLWILNNNTFQFINVINSKLDTIQQFQYKGAKPITFESDMAGNLWIVCKDSLLFYSVRTMKISVVKLLKPCNQVQLFEVNNNLLIAINQDVYKCTNEGLLAETKWNGDIILLPSSSILTFHDVSTKNRIGVSSLYINNKYVIYIFNIEINNDIIQTKLLANYQSDLPIIDVFAESPAITLFTKKQTITLDLRQFRKVSTPILFQKELNSLPICNITETINNAPHLIYFRYNNTEEYEEGSYQIKFEPFDSCWVNYANSEVFPIPQLKKGIYKLHVRYCSGDGLVLAQSTLLIDIDDSIWLKRQMLFLYIPLLLGFLILLIHILYRIKIHYKLKIEESVIQRTNVINEEKHKLQKLLEAFVPREASNEIIEKGKTTYKRFDGVSVLFADIEGFSIIAGDLNPELLIEQLDDLFYRFDYIVGKYGIEKIKTIGDAYMCAGGLPIKHSSNPIEMILAAMEMLNYVDHLTIRLDFNWKVRIGIHTGTVIAGVIGQKKLAYDIWGDTVNIANRIESSSVAGRINISIETFKLVKDFFECEYRGRIPIKNRGEIEMYFVKGIHPWLVENRKPNAEFNLHLQLIRLNDLSEVVFEEIDKNMPSNLYFHTAVYIHQIYSQSICISKKMGLTIDNQIVLQTAALCLFYGMIEHYDNYWQESIAFVRKHLPEYKYNRNQIESICKTLEVVNTLNPTTLVETLLLEIIYAYWGVSYFPEQIRALYIEESEMLERLSWNDWLKLKLNRFEKVLKLIDLERVQFEIAPEVQIQKLKTIKI